MEIHNLTTLLTMATSKSKRHSNSFHDHYSCLPTGILKHRGFDQEIHINPNSNPHQVLFRKHHSRQSLHVLLLLPMMGRDLQRNSAQRGKGCSPQRRSSMIRIAANSLAQSTQSHQGENHSQSCWSNNPHFTDCATGFVAWPCFKIRHRSLSAHSFYLTIQHTNWVQVEMFFFKSEISGSGLLTEP